MKMDVQQFIHYLQGMRASYHHKQPLYVIEISDMEFAKADLETITILNQLLNIVVSKYEEHGYVFMQSNKIAERVSVYTLYRREYATLREQQPRRFGPVESYASDHIDFRQSPAHHMYKYSEGAAVIDEVQNFPPMDWAKLEASIPQPKKAATFEDAWKMLQKKKEESS